ncbi:MAG: alpha/beta hydrolase [Planctomycetota bacterium]
MSTLDSQLNLRLRHPDFQKYLDVNEKQSERVRQSFSCSLDQKYGMDLLQSMDVFPSPIPDSPIVIFIHGGYWRALDKASYSFVTEPFVQNNCTVCILNYRLMPRVKMQAILNDVRDAVLWIMEESSRFHGDPHQIVLSGHSAGGHLALMCYLLNESIRNSIRAICSLSGIFELAPIKRSYLNDDLQLDDDEVEKFSFSSQVEPELACPLYLGVGSAESDFFILQSRTLGQQLSKSSRVQFEAYKGLNHYDVVHQLGSEASDAVQFILKAIAPSRP